MCGYTLWQKSTVHQEFAPPRQQLSQRLREQGHRKRLERWRNQYRVINHHKALAHSALLLQLFCRQKYDCVPPPSLLAWNCSLWFIFLSESTIGASMVSYPECPRNSGTMADHPKRDSKRAILVVLPALGETLDPSRKPRILKRTTKSFKFHPTTGHEGTDWE
jgi:hypothetical protein